MITAHTPTQQPVAYNPWDAQQTRHQEPSFNPDTYNATGVLAEAAYAAAPISQPRQAEHDYGASDVPQQSDPYNPSRYQNPTNLSSSPPPINAYAAPTSAVRGPRGLNTVVMSPPDETYSDSPPTYDSGPSRQPGQWGTKS